MRRRVPARPLPSHCQSFTSSARTPTGEELKRQSVFVVITRVSEEERRPDVAVIKLTAASDCGDEIGWV